MHATEPAVGAVCEVNVSRAGPLMRNVLSAIMNSEIPFAIESLGWDDLSKSDRDFFCFRDEYLPLPSDHAAQIQRLKPDVARRIWQWLGPSLPSGWPESEPHFENQAVFRLDYGNWNTDEGVQTVRQWLHDRSISYSTDVFLVYEADQIIRMPWKLLVRYWDALAWSVGYSMIAMDHTRQWACCFHHENVIVFGTFLEERDRTSRCTGAAKSGELAMESQSSPPRDR